MTERKVYDEEGHIQFVTFSCYKRRRLLDDDVAKRIVIGVLASQLAKQKGYCLGFVIMPDHVHAMVWFPEKNQVVHFMKQWKQRTSIQIQKRLKPVFPNYFSHTDSSDPVWQARFYAFNVYSDKKVNEKLDYMHCNPVKAGFVKDMLDWKYSSARWYVNGESVGVPIRVP